MHLNYFIMQHVRSNSLSFRIFNFYRQVCLCIILTAGITMAVKSQTTPAVTYPRITGYVATIHPIVTIISSNKPVYNFNGTYVIGLVAGINIWKNARVGFSLEFVPFIRADKAGSKMNNFLFHPGILVALGKGFTFAGRAGFETSGRYGLTPVISKVVKKGQT